MQFDASKMSGTLMKTGQEISATYHNIPSTEIWSVENVNSTIRQIEYCIDTNVFASKNDIVKIFDCLEKMMDHIELQAEAGYKINLTGKGKNTGASYNVYVNEFIVGDNMVMPVTNGKKMVYLNHSHINVTLTKDVKFCDYIYNFFQSVIHKSTLISVVCAKERLQFFNRIKEHIVERKNAALL